MDADAVRSSMREALAACAHPRWFETERGFQGQLLVELAKRIRLPDQAIIEQEYQKRLADHGLRIRPDIIIHEPYDPDRHTSRANGNIAVIELKLNGSAEEATADFASLSAMLSVLDYPLGIFVNIASRRTYAELVPEEAKNRIVSYAVSFIEGKAEVIEAAADTAIPNSGY
jgi:hypothetical protein